MMIMTIVSIFEHGKMKKIQTKEQTTKADRGEILNIARIVNAVPVTLYSKVTK